MAELVSRVNNVYERARAVRIHTYEVHHPSLFSLCRMYMDFRKAVGGDEFWDPFVRLLGTFCFRALTTPLPFDELLRERTDVKQVQRLIVAGRNVDPSNAGTADRLLNRFRDVHHRKENPLFDAIIRAIKDERSDTAVVLRDTTVLPQVEQYFSQKVNWRNVRFIGPADLRDLQVYTRIVLVGGLRWFPSYVVQAPRSEELYVVRFAWIRDQIPELKLLEDGQGQCVTRLTSARIVRDGSAVAGVNIDDLVGRPAARRRNEGNVRVDDEEELHARLVMLAGGYGVFLDEVSSVMILDFESDSRNRVRRIPFDLLRPGMFVILRTQGPGDFVAAVADRLLGDRAPELRRMQSEWKARLRRIVRSQGARHVASLLRRRGCAVASETNVRYWTTERAIRTRRFSDFAAIMGFIGMQEQSEEYWEAMGVIDAAHRRAGNHIRRLLLNQVSNASGVPQAARSGIIDFSLPDPDAGRLTAFRVEGISERVLRVPVSRIGRPVEGLGLALLGE